MIILFAVGADNQGAEEHLRMLAMFSKKLGNDAVVSQLEEEELDLDEISIL